jgi:hypothetical protein
MVAVTEASELYGVARERFIPERAAVVKALRGDGRREEATRVAGLRKPSVAAWAVNQLTRTQRAALTDLFAIGDELSRAHADLLGGRGDPGAVRAATERERDAVDVLTRAAGGLLTGDGHELSPATLARVADTLHAAARDEQARDQVRGGCLERELRLVGLGSGAAVSDPAGAQREPTARRRADRERADREQAERAERAERLTAARRSESDARREADRTARALASAQQHRDRAAEKLRDADAALATAQEQAAAATDGLRSAERALQRAGEPPASGE